MIVYCTLCWFGGFLNGIPSPWLLVWYVNYWPSWQLHNNSLLDNSNYIIIDSIQKCGHQNVTGYYNSSLPHTQQQYTSSYNSCTAGIGTESCPSCFCCGLFLRLIRRPWMLGWSLNGFISPGAETAPIDSNFALFSVVNTCTLCGSPSYRSASGIGYTSKTNSS